MTPTYAYGDLHVIRLDGAYGIGLPLMDVSADGGISSVNVAPGNAYADGGLVSPWPTTWIPMDRIVARFEADGRPRVEVNFPLGNVADPTSPHFDGQLTAWTDGVYQPLLFERAEITAAAESTRRLAR